MIKKKIKSALMYTSIMFTVAITVSAFMLVKVVPVFAKMYDGMCIELQAATATIMGMSDFLRGSGGQILVLSLIIFFFVFRYLTSKNEKIKYAWHKQVLKLPIFGDMILKSMLARISLIMGNLSAAGVNLLEIPGMTSKGSDTTNSRLNTLGVGINLSLGPETGKPDQIQYKRDDVHLKIRKLNARRIDKAQPQIWRHRFLNGLSTTTQGHQGQ